MYLNDSENRIKNLSNTFNEYNESVRNGTVRDDLHLKIGKLALNNGKYDFAISALNRTLAMYPKDIEAIKTIVQTYIETKEYELALKDITKGLVYYNDNIDLLYLKALILYKVNLYDSALKILNTLITYDQNSYKYYELRGEILLKSYQYKSSNNDLIKAIDINDKNSNVYSLLSKLNEENSNYNRAIECINNAIRLEPKNIEYKIRKGKLLIKDKQYERAYEYFKKVTSKHDQNIEALLSMAYILDITDNESAISLYNSIIKKYPASTKALEARSKYLYKNGETNKAINDLNAIIDIDNNITNIRVELARIYIAEKRYGEAEKLLQSEKLIDNKSLEASKLLITVYDKMNDTESKENAIKSLNQTQKVIEADKKLQNISTGKVPFIKNNDIYPKIDEDTVNKIFNDGEYDRNINSIINNGSLKVAKRNDEFSTQNIYDNSFSIENKGTNRYNELNDLDFDRKYEHSTKNNIDLHMDREYNDTEYYEEDIQKSRSIIFISFLIFFVLISITVLFLLNIKLFFSEI